MLNVFQMFLATIYYLIGELLKYKANLIKTSGFMSFTILLQY